MPTSFLYDPRINDCLVLLNIHSANQLFIKETKPPLLLSYTREITSMLITVIKLKILLNLCIDVFIIKSSLYIYEANCLNRSNSSAETIS